MLCESEGTWSDVWDASSIQCCVGAKLGPEGVNAGGCRPLWSRNVLRFLVCCHHTQLASTEDIMGEKFFRWKGIKRGWERDRQTQREREKRWSIGLQRRDKRRTAACSRRDRKTKGQERGEQCSSCSDWQSRKKPNSQSGGSRG